MKNGSKNIWTSRADRAFTEILKFYVERNGSKTYSRRLNREIRQSTQFLIKNPYLGFQTDFEGMRALVKNNYKIIYQVRQEEIVIHLIWDSRQDPDALAKAMK